MTTTYSPLRSTMDRNTFVTILQTALDVGNPKFARQLVLAWLAVYPGDLEAAYYLAKTQAAEEKLAQAIGTLEKVCDRDPEYLDAQRELANLYQRTEMPKHGPTVAKAFVLGQENVKIDLPLWSKALRAAQKALDEQNYDLAEAELHPVLGDESGGILAAIYHVKVVRAKEDAFTAKKLADLYHERWPECLVFDLVRAEAMIHLGNEAEGMSILHHCVARDIQGLTAKRLWGAVHPFSPLWPRKQEIEYGYSIPAEIASRFGWNQLEQGGVVIEPPSTQVVPGPEAVTSPPVSDEPPAAYPTPIPTEEAPSSSNVIITPAPVNELIKKDDGIQPTTVEESKLEEKVTPTVPGRPSSPVTKDETLISVEAEFDSVAKRLHNPALSKGDGRYPVYVVFSCISGLRSVYGQQTAEIILKEMSKLVEVARKRPRWGAMVFCPDDPGLAKEAGLSVINKTDAWTLKLALKDLDEALSKRGEMIGAVLIIGGDNVVPFHQLPNPTDDIDDTIPSDNPYASLDANYFVPEWPVGRLVGEAGTDAGLLLEQLRASIRLQSSQVKLLGNRKKVSLSGLAEFLKQFFHQTPNGNIGYSAAIWRRSSLAAFRPIGEGRSLWVSPPSASGEINAGKLLKAGLGYYNLHGMQDTGEWFGQRDLSDASDGPDYPVALKPGDLVKNGRVPKVVFTEACYGGSVSGKTEQSSIALRFLSLGTPAVVGSTTIAYGSVESPLIGADLLGYLFWKYLKEGYTAGEALLRAKVSLAQEMTRRQGFLDGEDQKTLISFTLYGDPFAVMPSTLTKISKFARERKHILVRTVCDRNDDDLPDPKIPGEVLAQVKRTLSSYLPGIDTAEVIISTQHIGCNSKNHQCPTGELGPKTKTKTVRGQAVVTFAKQVRIAQRTQYSYAKVTLDATGKLMKLAVSR